MKPIAAVAAIAFVALPLVVGAPRASPTAPSTSCIEVGGVSVWGGIGWDHIVYLTNRCEPTFVCAVSTDVNPEPQQATVLGNTTVQVITSLNSPSRVFFPHVACEATSGATDSSS